MHGLKIPFALGLIAAALLMSCGQSDSPTEPQLRFEGAKLVEAAPCGESIYLGELSPLLAAWEDSLELWLPGADLATTPEYDGGPTAGYLDLLIPVLSTWPDSVNSAAGSELFAALVAFEEQGTQEYLGLLSPALAAWEAAAEAAREADFLPDAPVFAPDESAPLMECPADTMITCADAQGVVFEFEVSAIDDCDVAPVVVCQPESGSIFPVGTTTVECTATDASGNVSTCSFDVTVEADESAPLMQCPADTMITCADREGVVFDFEVSAVDDCDEAPIVVCQPESGSVFPVGTTTVECTATDASGNVSTCSFDVTVEAAEVTVLSAAASPAVLWPPNHKMVDISFEFEVENECEIEYSCSVLEVTSNEAINGTGDGNTEPDWMIGEDGSLQLRAERSGGGDGRVYSVLVLCEDSNGGSSEVTVEVVVPHDQGGD